jgi:hypothetical protein
MRELWFAEADIVVSAAAGSQLTPITASGSSFGAFSHDRKLNA